MAESMREQIEESWSGAEELETEASPEVVAEASNPIPEQTEEQPEVVEESKPEMEAKPDAEPAPQSPEAPTDKKTEEKAPQSWSPTNREKWGALPPEVKSQIAKRESEVEGVLRKSAESRRVADQLAKTVEPYRQSMMAAGYNSPFEAINTLFRAESTLRAGTQHEKAAQVAQLISQYGVDISTLDQVLSGNPQTQQSSNPDLESLLQQRLAPYEKFMQQQQQQQQYAAQQESQQARQTVQQFQAEFLDDVRLDMADIIDMAAKRGQQMSLQDAYDRACVMHPEISKVMKQREEQKALMGTTENAQRKRNAASASLTGRQSGNPAPNGNISMRDMIQNAWDDQTG